MNETQANQPSNLSEPKHSIALLILLFAGSGCAALIYEIVWFQLLQLVVGSSAVSLAVVLGTFMGGMCLGSLALPRIVSDRHHPLKVYALLELGIGIIGLLVLFVMPSLGSLYTSIGGYGASGFLLRGMVSGICLLPPTILMGATLPAIARWVETTPLGISRLGFFYGANIAGAVLGSLLAGFYLLRIHDMAIASYVAAAINLSVALISFLLARARLYRPPVADLPEATMVAAPGSRTVYIAIALSGLCALGAQVVWSRLLSLMFGGTVYTLSIILAVFLVGLGVGSSVGSMRARWSKHPRLELGVCQMLLIAAIAWSAYMLTRSLPYWPIDPTMALSPWFNFQMDLFRCTWAILPAACLWGASFPLALAAAASRGSDAGKLVGGIYAANTVGAIVGATTFSLIVITVWDTQRAQQALIGFSALAALLVLAPVVWPFRNNKFDLRVGASVAVTFLVAVMLILSVPPVPGPLVAYGRSLPRVLALRDAETKDRFVPNILYVGEGLNASVAVSEISGRSRNFHVSGKIEASTLPRDMRLQRMLGHLPALNHPQPRSVLIVGFGAGITAGTFLAHPSIERIVICEIEPLIPEVVSRYFRTENNAVLEDPRVEVIYDDARHYILTSDEKFDIITSDPIHPWVKGAAALYTREYFELARQHLNPGGVISQWVPLYESSMEVVKSEIATFFEVFPDGTVWSNDLAGTGYDVVLLGKDAAPTIEVDAIDRRLGRSDHINVNRSLQAIGFQPPISLLTTYLSQASDLVSWLADAEINRDRNLRLQYLAGMGLDLSDQSIIYDAMTAYRSFPEDLFLVSDELGQVLRQALDRTP